ncbi:MAG: Nre family DNA repair protein [Candidatus Micrarchaeia archaeon]
MHPPASMCVSCQGSRNLCGLGQCPILQRVQLQNSIFLKAKAEIFGPSPPNIFVGHTGYPTVAVGAMASDVPVEDDPRRMFGQPLESIIQSRSQLFRSAVKREVTQKDKYVRDMQEIVLSTAPVDVELKFKYVPKQEVTFSPLVQPMGPLGQLEKYSIVGNPKIPARVDSLASEGVATTTAVKELLYRGYDNYYLTKVLSAGVLGQQQRQRLVPTRWSITAMDDMISKIHMESVREFPEISSYELYFSEYLHNRYAVMLMPGRWEFENFEAWAKGSLWNLDTSSHTGAYITVEYEPFGGRSDYADLQVGGYYASRYAVTEHLFERRRQARVMVIREVDPAYVVPVGVWQVRENVRNAFRAGPTKFSSLKDMLDYAALLLKNPIGDYLKADVMLKQSRLTDYMC